MPNESPQFNVLLRSEQSNGEVATIEIVLPAGSAGPPLHHHDFDEAFYVLDGELTFQLGEELATAGPGTLTFAPRGSHHTLANLSAADARYLLVCTPAGFERYFHPFASMLDNLTMTQFVHNSDARVNGADVYAHPDRFFIASRLAANTSRRNRPNTFRSTSGTAIISIPCCWANSCTKRRSSAASAI